MHKLDLFFSRVLVLLLVGMPGCSQDQGGGFSVQVVSATVEIRAIDEVVHAVGSLVPNEAIDVVGKIGGRVEAIHVREGARVAAGDPLFDIDLVDAQAQLARAEAAYQLARMNRDRTAQLREAGAVPEQAVDEARNAYSAARAEHILAQQRIADAALRAPFGGVIGARRVSPGQVVAPGTVLTRLVDDHPVKIEIAVPERHLATLRSDQTFTARVAAFAGTPFTGEVVFVAPEVDIQTRTVLIKGVVPNPDSILRPGMLAEVELVVGRNPNALLVPETAVVRTAAGASVFVIEDGKAQSRRIVTGARLPGYVQVIDGLAAGEDVVVEGTQKVRPGVPVTPEPLTASTN